MPNVSDLRCSVAAVDIPAGGNRFMSRRAAPSRPTVGFVAAPACISANVGGFVQDNFRSMRGTTEYTDRHEVHRVIARRATCGPITREGAARGS